MSINAIGSRSCHKKCLIGYLDISLTWFDLSEVKVQNWVKVIPRSLGQGQGHFMENANLAPGHKFNLSELKVTNEVKVTPRSRLFQGQIVSV